MSKAVSQRRELVRKVANVKTEVESTLMRSNSYLMAVDEVTTTLEKANLDETCTAEIILATFKAGKIIGKTEIKSRIAAM